MSRRQGAGRDGRAERQVAVSGEWLEWLSILSDGARVRVLRLLDGRELGVGELAKALQMPQSTVSRQLKPLFDAGWIVKRTEGTASLYGLNRADLNPSALELWELTRERIGQTRTFQEDDARLAAVLQERRTDSRSFFGRVGGEWDAMRVQLFGEGFGAAALLHLIDASWVVADLGCGTGNASAQLAPVVRKVIAVDRESAMLDAAKVTLGEYSNVEFRKGEIEKLPLRDGEVDAAVMFLVLHHLAEPARAVAEVARCLKPHGVLLLVDMVAHERQEYRQTMGHKHLGFEPGQLRSLGRAAGLSEVRTRRLPPDTASKGPGLFVCVMARA